MAKAYNLTVEDKGRYLHFRVTGPNTPEVVRGYLTDVYFVCAQRERAAILIEENLEGPGLGLVDIFEIVTEGTERTWPHIRRLAYVDVNPAHSQPDLQFAETVALNRGINMRLFSSLTEAEKWIGS